MTSPARMLLAELVRPDSIRFISKVRLSDAIPDGTAVIERKIWSWNTGQRRTDTFWISEYTRERVRSEWLDYAYSVADRAGRGPWPNYVPIPTEPIGPVEIPRAISSELPAALWPILEGSPVQMRIGLHQIDVSKFLKAAPWYVDAFNSLD